MIKMMQEIGAASDGYTRFKDNLQFAFRVTFFACVLASTVWVPMVRKLFPDTLAGYMGLAALLYIFTVQKIFGAAIQSGIGKIWATFLAALHMWVLQGFFPWRCKSHYTSVHHICWLGELPGILVVGVLE